MQASFSLTIFIAMIHRVMVTEIVLFVLFKLTIVIGGLLFK